ncbi:MAG: hypothetical protein RIE24_05380 [Silicimonas sp.]|jgi:hypothetical protein|uniref:hypothetical protein n=1 Tax=Alphaproteobacteria TaxID=28211 RepID=UPI0032ECC567
MSSDNKEPRALEGEVVAQNEPLATVPMTPTLGFMALSAKWLERRGLEAEARVERARADKVRAETEYTDAVVDLEISSTRLNNLADIRALVAEGIKADLAEKRQRTAAANRALSHEEKLAAAEASELEARQMEAELKKMRLQAKLDRTAPDLDTLITAGKAERQRVMDEWAERRQSGAGVTEAEEDAYSQKIRSLTDRIATLEQKKAEDDD